VADPRRPAFSQSQRPQQRTEQRLALEPRLLMAVELLALPAAELEVWLADAFQRNEALVVEQAHSPVHEPPRARNDREATARHSEWLESQPDHSSDVRARLLADVRNEARDPEERAWLELLVDCLDADGLLGLDDAALLALARDHGLAGGERELGRAIAALQAAAPRGVGGRSREEALLLQLDPADGDYGALCGLIEHHLADLEHNRLPRVAKDLGIDVEHLTGLVERLADLSPRPLAAEDDEAAAIVVPDLVVEWDGDRWHLSCVRGHLPTVSIDPRVVALANDRSQPTEVRRRLRASVREATWITDAVARRETTLLRVAAAALAHQPRFFERGPAGLEPLTMSEVAEELELHTSTVSRAVAGKTVQTPFGVIALRLLFPEPASEGSHTSRGEAADLVAELIRAEDHSAPLSDEDLVRELARRGVKLARRTVAKHREALGLASSYRRRKHA
jgi:RNA polymerase sigma-54 factor